MQRLFPTVFAVLLFGGGIAVAQVGSTNMSRAPASRAPATAIRSLMAVPGTIPTVAGGNPLGAIQLNLGSLGPIPAAPLGTIAICPTTGIANSATSAAVDASSTMGISGLASASSLSSASSPVVSPFGTSILSSACSPTGAAITTSSSDTGAASGLLNPSAMTSSTFGDATTVAGTTEVGGSGMSPLIIVPTPNASVTPCDGTSMQTQSSSLAISNDGTSVAAISGLSSSGC
jgi:hypothetical protein